MRVIQTTDGKNVGSEIEVGELNVGDEITLQNGYVMEVHQIIESGGLVQIVNANYLIILA
jgi:hypothetical protein